MSLNPLEKEIQLAICDYLALRKVFFWRQNTIPPVDHKGNGKMVFRPMPKYSLKGVPDIIVIKDGKFWGLEVKRPKGKPSEHQMAFMKNCILNGGEYHIVTSIEDVQKLGL